MENLFGRWMGEMMEKMEKGCVGTPGSHETFFQELCTGHDAEVKALVDAFKQGSALEIAGSPPEDMVAGLTRRLVDSCGVQNDVAQWAAKNWAMVVGRSGRRAQPVAPTASAEDPQAATEAAMCVEISAMLLSAHDYGDAIECCDQALKINPSFAWAWYNKGFALHRLGHKPEARICYERAKNLGHLLAPSELPLLDQAL